MVGRPGLRREGLRSDMAHGDFSAAKRPNKQARRARIAQRAAKHVRFARVRNLLGAERRRSHSQDSRGREARRAYSRFADSTQRRLRFRARQIRAARRSFRARTSSAWARPWSPDASSLFWRDRSRSQTVERLRLGRTAVSLGTFEGQYRSPEALRLGPAWARRIRQPEERRGPCPGGRALALPPGGL